LGKRLFVVARGAETLVRKSQVISILNLVFSLYMHIVTGNCADYLSSRVKGKLFPINGRRFTNAMIKIVTMALTADHDKITLKFSFLFSRGQYAVETNLRMCMAGLTFTSFPMRRVFGFLLGRDRCS
jgi:hypothetical protein